MRRCGTCAARCLNLRKATRRILRHRHRAGPDRLSLPAARSSRLCTRMMLTTGAYRAGFETETISSLLLYSFAAGVHAPSMLTQQGTATVSSREIRRIWTCMRRRRRCGPVWLTHRACRRNAKQTNQARSVIRSPGVYNKCNRNKPRTQESVLVYSQV